MIHLFDWTSMHIRIASVAALLLLLTLSVPTRAQEARLLRQPDLGATRIAFTYGSDIWVVGRDGGEARRITSTAAVESDPHFSPDGQWIAFTSNRAGTPAVYVVSVDGGTPTRLTWYPAAATARGWTPDGSRILYSSSRENFIGRLWTVSPAGGPSELLPAPRGHRASYSPDGSRIVVEPISRWDVEWRDYRGGQNQQLIILDLDDLDETRIPGDRSTDIEPVWMGNSIYFMSDRDWAMNVWSYDVATGALNQVTHFDGAEVKSLSGHDGMLVIEQDGWIHTLDPSTGRTAKVGITVRGDFPWMEAGWEDVSDRAGSAALSATGQRVAFEARGEIFTVPAEKGASRNLTRSDDAADRAPVWSPDGASVAWFSDAGGDGYTLMIADQDGLSEPRSIDIGESKLGWEPAWSPDGKYIAFTDDDVRVRVLDVESGDIRTVDIGGTNMERGGTGLTWSHDSKWLAYAKSFPNNLGRIVVWSVETEHATPITDMMADASNPSWDRDGRHLYFLASTDVALGSGWANTSAMKADPSYAVYVSVLRADDPTPFPPESDEEPIEEDDGEDDQDAEGEETEDTDDDEAEEDDGVRIDFDGIERRIMALPMPVASYGTTVAGPEGSVFVTDNSPDGPGATLRKFVLDDREATEFATSVSQVSVSSDGEKMLFRSGPQWRIVGTGAPPQPGDGGLDVSLRMRLDRSKEWQQMFDEAWRYQRDYFYDPGMHGNDWDAVYERYAPLVPYVRHRADLNYILDQTNGELSVGHSFVFGGDMPDVESTNVGLLGADFAPDDGRWRIERIYTSESWNPGLSAPLDRPGIEVEEGNYLVGMDGVEMTTGDDPYRLLEGTAGRQTVLHINDRPSMEEAWTVTVEPIGSEYGLRQRAWVEDNRRTVDELSNGRLAYVWIPNTGGGGVVSFDRYFFAQQDKPAAVIDERFNGGGLLDDYMVDLMTRTLRAAITNEVPNGRPFRLPAGILGPKVLLINEMAGSGGDFFPWVFRHQQAGPLIGKRTWGGLVKSSVHYALVDGGALTAPDNAVFDPVAGRFIAENEGVPPDIEVEIDARSAAEGRDPQLERAVEEALRLLDEADLPEVRNPPYPRPSRRPGQ